MSKLSSSQVDSEVKALIKSMEGLGELERRIEIYKLFEGKVFATERRLKGSEKTGVENVFFINKELSHVFCFIYSNKTETISWTLMNYSTYKDVFVSNPDAILYKVHVKNTQYKIVVNGGKYSYVAFHRVVTSCESKDQVDHITHNTYINIKEYLRNCTAGENNKNKAFCSSIAEDKKSFSITIEGISDSERVILLQNGYRLDRGDSIDRFRVCSPEFETTSEMYKALNAFETKYLGEFRYNPLVDFKETWYALVIQKMLGGISDEELHEYNREYMIKNHKDIAEYYQLEVIK